MRRLLLDQGLPRSAARLLNEAGWDVVHVSDIGMSRSGDDEILQRARVDARACVTLDADFHALLVTNAAHGSSVIRIRKEGLGAVAFLALLSAIWPSIDAALVDGALATVTEHSIRIRRLPVVLV